ncbi:MAG: hypothetical protein U0930_04720 [Pirellulales bacterium]
MTTTDPTTYTSEDDNWVGATQIPQAVIDASPYLSAIQDANDGAVIVYADGANIVDPQLSADWSNASSITQSGVGIGKSTQDLWAELHEYPQVNAGSWNPTIAQTWFEDTWQPQVGLVTLASGTCGCSAKWARMVELSPPDYSTARNFAYWAFDQHLRVSRTILHHHFTKFTWEQAKAKWSYPGAW